MIYFTADLHLGHANIIKYCQRPFQSVSDMDKAIIDNIMTKLNRGDTLHILGDLALNIKIYEDFVRLCHTSGINLVIVRGGYDRIPYHLTSIFKIPIYDLKTIKIGNHPIVLCHYCLRVWDRSHYNSWHLFGHSHGTLEAIGKSHDVGVDNNNFMPLSFDEIKDIMSNRPDNPNLVGKNGRNN